MRTGSHYFLRCAAILLLCAQLVPAQLACSCDASGPMDCCRTAEVQQIASSACCSGGEAVTGLHARSCTRASDASSPLHQATLVSSVEQGRPQLDQNVFLSDEPSEPVFNVDHEVVCASHGPPGSVVHDIYLFCASLLI